MYVHEKRKSIFHLKKILSCGINESRSRLRAKTQTMIGPNIQAVNECTAKSHLHYRYTRYKYTGAAVHYTKLIN